VRPCRCRGNTKGEVDWANEEAVVIALKCDMNFMTKRFTRFHVTCTHKRPALLFLPFFPSSLENSLFLNPFFFSKVLLGWPMVSLLLLCKEKDL